MSNRTLSYVILSVALLLPLMAILAAHHNVNVFNEAIIFLQSYLLKALILTALIMYLCPIRIPWHAVLLTAVVMAIAAQLQFIIVGDVQLFLEHLLYMVGLGALIKYIYSKKLL
jgi:hypothetical protein